MKVSEGVNMSRDDFDFINLTEKLEKNTEELIREVKTETAQKTPRVLQTDFYGEDRTGQSQLENRATQQNGYHHQARGNANQDMYAQQSTRNMEQDILQTSRINRQQESQQQASGKVAQNSPRGDREQSEKRNIRPTNTSELSRKKNRGSNKDKEERNKGMAARKRRGKKKSSKTKKNNLKKKLIKIGIVFLALFGAVYGLAYSMISKTNYEKRETDYVRASDVKKVSGVKNILLIGTDARSTEEDGRSDSMILVSVNNKKNRIVMTSILRDSYVEIPGHGNNRINAAYSYGQEDLLIQTIEHNYKIPIDGYAKVDFFSFIDIVDSVGGVEIEITQDEMKWINAYLNETNELLGKEFGDGYLTEAGLVNLTGKQALSFARIRYIGTDFGRTERQRKILTAVLDKVKKNPASVTDLMDSVLPNVTTDIKTSELTMMAMQSVMYLGYDMEQFTLPADNTWKNATISGMSVLEVNFEANIQAFKDKVYGDGTETEETTQE